MDNKSEALFVLWTEYDAPIDLLAEVIETDPREVEYELRQIALQRTNDLFDLEIEVEDADDCDTCGLPEYDTPDEWAEHVRNKGEVEPTYAEAEFTEVVDTVEQDASHGVQIIDAINAAATKPWGQMSADEKLSLVRATIPGGQ